MEDDADDKGGWTDMVHYGAELAYLIGPAWFQAEWIWGEFNRDVMSGDTNTFTSNRVVLIYSASYHIILYLQKHYTVLLFIQ